MNMHVFGLWTRENVWTPTRKTTVWTRTPSLRVEQWTSSNSIMVIRDQWWEVKEGQDHDCQKACLSEMNRWDINEVKGISKGHETTKTNKVHLLQKRHQKEMICRSVCWQWAGADCYHGDFQWQWHRSVSHFSAIRVFVEWICRIHWTFSSTCLSDQLGWHNQLQLVSRIMRKLHTLHVLLHNSTRHPEALKKLEISFRHL